MLDITPIWRRIVHMVSDIACHRASGNQGLEIKMKPIHTITKNVNVGIYDAEYVARIYKDKVIVVSPYIKWVGNTEGYSESKKSIRDQKTVDRIIKELNNGCEDTAWGIIGNQLQDTFLAASGL